MASPSATFCTTLRKRKEWNTLPATLLGDPKRQWQEKTLETHDLALALSRYSQEDNQEFFRLLLLSSSDLLDPTTSTTRIERLFHQSGGRNVGIIFLLHDKAPGKTGTIGYMNLQANILGVFDMPILPLYSIASFQQTLDKFRRAVSSSTKPKSVSSGNPAVVLLPYCTLRPPIPEHTRNILGEEYHCIAELAQAATTPDGQVALRRLLPDPSNSVVDEVIDFWAQEYCTE
ncbi:hypothetical protein GLAREA_07532 [Glarea lozoyensis ATCC 20868]|uniref:Uncharacterized protein n=1 Tax=Glarea lozoyensis (strain ATCC 20868 / MF5171) TaxID=1116229 RepID=S3D5K8_GLAL2|nr:uncharacterized protein GLAREA_07532 [Glarea lozoyensis ATCC 20868]EPE32399.1 hypothetical protein GLAREA_07532 [Glarea lozoyensis ATCC 20868]